MTGATVLSPYNSRKEKTTKKEYISVDRATNGVTNSSR